MEPLTKHFTMIDILGIFLSGSAITLTVNSCFLDLTVPVKEFFGEHVIVLAVYFVFISYLAGSAMEQICCFAEQLLFGILKINMHKSHYNEQGKLDVLQEAYKKSFHMDYPADDKARVAAGKEIFHYVQKNGRPERIVIFSAFYLMSRSMTITLPLIALLIVFSEHMKWKIMALILSAVILFCTRWLSFEQKCVDEAYMLFITDSNSK